MICLQNANFNRQYFLGLTLAIDPAREIEASRAGPVINLGQAFFEIAADDPRLIFLNARRINPVFAIVEGAWVLMGSDKLAPLKNEISDFEKYSDDGDTLFGAYGKRLRERFGFDQIDAAIEILRLDPASRRVVLNMYSPSDLTAISKDIPCNTSVFLKIVDGSLDMTVINRSNDLFLGVPYNVFVFGLLQRFVSEKLNCPIGIQRHFTDCLHLYERDLQRAKQVVAANNIDEIDELSSVYNWNYSGDILENIHKINSRSYEKIDGELGKFLSKFCSDGRKEAKRKLIDYEFSTGFFGFMAKQWLGTPTKSAGAQDQEGNLDKKNISLSKGNFIEFSSRSAADITTFVSKVSRLLAGRLSEIKILDMKANESYLLNYFNNVESRALSALLLSALWSSIDPYVAGSPSGQRMIGEIKSAGEALNLSADEISHFSVDTAGLEFLLASVLSGDAFT